MEHNEENHPKAAVIPKSASKRSFDVAFLTGNAESASREKSAFTKYKDQKNNNEASATPPSEDNNATPTSSGLNNIPFSPNLMQFPALRKLLDITGKTSMTNFLEPINFNGLF